MYVTASTLLRAHKRALATLKSRFIWRAGDYGNAWTMVVGLVAET
jgi:hypothetical protein